MGFHRLILLERNVRVFIGHHHQHRLFDLVQTRCLIHLAHHRYEAAEKILVGAAGFIDKLLHERGVGARRKAFRYRGFKKAA